MKSGDHEAGQNNQLNEKQINDGKCEIMTKVNEG